MAAYFHGNSEIQAASGGDGMQQTIYLMNPNYIPYSDTTNNMLFLNHVGNALTPANLSHAPPSTHHPLVGIPLPSPSGPSQQPSSHQSSFPTAVQYDLWSSMDQNNNNSDHQIRQGLSLSLSSRQGAVTYNNNNNNRLILDTGDEDHETRVETVSPQSNGISSATQNNSSVILRSKYLQGAHELLDEVVNVIIKTTEESSTEANKVKVKMNKESAGESSSNIAAELTTAQRQELQIKKTKLANMLDEVEQRYRQYHNQMQLLVSLFEQAAGYGSAKSYTSLALRTISKQFRCLKDAISSQIKATDMKLGEEPDCLGAKGESSRLRYVDHQLRQQRALQQLGMMQHHAWRPQRGLPERAVSVLRAWLFEHFLHPYPKDSDKHILAKQTGLTRSQVSNWFINARVRLWKPMVEEMYLEEMKDQERNGGNSEENTSKTEQKRSSGSNTRVEQVVTDGSNSTMSLQPQSNGFNLIGSSSSDVIEISPKKPRISTGGDMHNNSPSNILSLIDVDMKQQGHDQTSSREFIGKFGDHERLTKDHGYSLLTSTNHGGGDGGFGTFSMRDFNPGQLAPRFHGNGVSLTLGLPHCENLLSSQNIDPLGRGLELGSSETSDFCGIETNHQPQPSHDSNSGYEHIDIQNRKRFAAQLLPDFVT